MYIVKITEAIVGLNPQIKAVKERFVVLTIPDKCHLKLPSMLMKYAYITLAFIFYL